MNSTQSNCLLTLCEQINIFTCLRTLLASLGYHSIVNEFYNVRIIFIGNIAVSVLNKLNLIIDQKWILYFFLRKLKAA